MKFLCLQENLNKGLNQVSRIATSKSSLPILENVLLKTEGGRLKMITTDLEAVIIQWVGGKVEKEGIITLPCRLFTEYVSSVPNNKIELISENDTDLSILTDEYEATIKGQSAEEFPIIPEIKENKFTTINAKELSDALSEVVYAAAINDSRPVLSGVLFFFDNKELKLVATDSYRLAEKKLKLKNEINDSKKIIIPAKITAEIQRILADIEESVDIFIGESQILFHSKDIDIIARLIDGNFPDYEKIIPDQHSTKANIDRHKFIKIVKAASLFARESGNSIKINLSPKGKVVVTANTSQLGDNTSQTEAEVTGTDGEISFNARYLLDVLNNLKGPSVSLEVSGKLKPGVIRQEGKPDYLHIIMPLNA
ncbi:DNA polymerase III subunit beta [bacterium CG_4_10_14_0_2_um_filter_33_32]|nr:MAG: DNA polymerase III subunit beta [bacterium CG2_30_33_46]PIR68025.1 MAG: DNA polymerase III subunit beta [bacterium CG10_big_fil_rev_8_21_14_0_10_33_18]PIU76290.1 MAG: DNA polymerase III subunit beta [bacterium CG06_land_8_20_14_3_00_33_50]PIW81124.1 MAG: DNA polymerase III subunit beta [bacterium CG_4_8_14_3_um_filter_33_28]PIY85661.1 MAG: DNA polymerase III subunit beta [bacterium CG_4_10_14_0_8_um_filter_33_57]PIZ85226.1 MAG: DNA polymerase III subunit beta [bacterium CG_4_10_14_0_2_